MRRYFIFLLTIFSTSASFADNGLLLRQSLRQALEAGKTNSSALESARKTEEAARFEAGAARAALVPNLSFWGSYFYQTNIPQFGNVGQLGAHNNYALGPALTYTLFDAGRNQGAAQFSALEAEARAQNTKAQEAQLTLSIAQAYCRVQYGLRQLELTLDSLKLALARNKDIALRLNVGAASRLDEMQSGRDVIDYRIRFRQAQAELGASVRDLLALEGDSRALDASRPMPFHLRAPDEMEPSTLELDFDPLEKTLAELNRQNFVFAGAAHPQAAALARQAEAAEKLAQSEKAALYPRLTLQAKTQYQYPNAMIPEDVWQNSVGANISFPVFDGSFSRMRSRQSLSRAASLELQKRQKINDLVRDAAKAKEWLANFQAQKKMKEDSAQQAKAIQRLTAESYQAGQARYLDVQEADLRLLQAQVAAAQIDAEILNQLSILNYLATQ